MSTKVEQTQPALNRPERLANIITHAVAAGLSFVGLVFLLLKTTTSASPLGIAAVSIYGTAMICMFVISTLYHAVPQGNAKARLHGLERSTVSVLVFGVFAPIMLIGLALGGGSDAVWGYSLFAVIAATAALAVVFNAVNFEKFKVFSLVAYVIMGWACVIRINRVYALCGAGCFWFLLGGALAYALGMVFYSIKKIPFNHTLMHLTVAAGAALHFVCIYVYTV